MQEAKVRVDERPVVCVGRQAILDQDRKVVGYELLYRDSSNSQRANVIDDTAATATVVVNTVAEMGCETVVGKRDMFINCSREVLELDLGTLLPPDKVVLEILESVEVNESLIERIDELRGMGFRIALDDVVTEDPRSQLVEHVDLVKVDLMSVPYRSLERLVKTELRGFTGQLLAEKVEDEPIFELCRGLGFGLFQGYFFCKPNVVAQKASPEDRSNVIRILSEVRRPDITVDEAVELIRQDVTVSYRLLKCLNSVVFGVRHPVESLRQALVLLGMPRVRAWLSLMALSMVKGKSSELMRLALVRANMCQELARVCQIGEPDTLFTVGLLSVLDAVLDLPMGEVLEQLPLSETIKHALLGQASPEADVLGSVLEYEQGQFVRAVSERTGIDLDALSTAWLVAVRRADSTASALLDC